MSVHVKKKKIYENVIKKKTASVLITHIKIDEFLKC